MVVPSGAPGWPLRREKKKELGMVSPELSPGSAKIHHLGGGHQWKNKSFENDTIKPGDSSLDQI